MYIDFYELRPISPIHNTASIPLSYVRKQLDQNYQSKLDLDYLDSNGILVSKFVAGRAGLPITVALVPPSPLTSPDLTSPNISTPRAYICKGSSFLVTLTVQNGSIHTNSSQKEPPSTISYIAGNCSDGVQLPAFSYASTNSRFAKTCSPLGYSTLHSFSSRVYTYQKSTYNLSSFAVNFTYRQATQIVPPVRVHVECRRKGAWRLYTASTP